MSKSFYLDQVGVQSVIYRGSDGAELMKLERQVAERALSEARAAFLQYFGFAGNLQLELKFTRVGGKSAIYIPSGFRPSYRIKAGDWRTGEALRAHPGWLARFAKDAKL